MESCYCPIYLSWFCFMCYRHNWIQPIYYGVAVVGPWGQWPEKKMLNWQWDCDYRLLLPGSGLGHDIFSRQSLLRGQGGAWICLVKWGFWTLLAWLLWIALHHLSQIYGKNIMYIIDIAIFFYLHFLFYVYKLRR